ncbi:hypothetical protein [Thalassolituus sp.]|uniref:hypothetical protein n=1 Tax=Thalassolituus sp. TaxID=2030822 RepID=UPI00261C35B2|nr:hypothetical protein [Thalassolituus sp.]
MPRTNNPVVGTVTCEDCGETATLHETKKGRHKTYLYKRCHSEQCGGSCDQSTSPVRQKRWRREIIPREGYEHLKEPGEPSNDAVPEPIGEPSPEPEKNQEQEPNEPKATGAPWIIAGIVGAVVFVAKIAKGAA